MKKKVLLIATIVFLNCDCKSENNQTGLVSTDAPGNVASFWDYDPKEFMPEPDMELEEIPQIDGYGGMKDYWDKKYSEKKYKFVIDSSEECTIDLLGDGTKRDPKDVISTCIQFDMTNKKVYAKDFTSSKIHELKMTAIAPDKFEILNEKSGNKCQLFFKLIGGDISALLSQVGEESKAKIGHPLRKKNLKWCYYSGYYDYYTNYPERLKKKRTK